MIGGHWSIDYIYLAITAYVGFISGYYGVFAFFSNNITSIPVVVSLALNALIALYAVYNTVIYKLNKNIFAKNFIFNVNTRTLFHLHTKFYELSTKGASEERPNDVLLGPHWPQIVSIMTSDLNSITSRFAVMFYDDRLHKFVHNTVTNILFLHHYIVIIIGLVGPILHYSVKKSFS